MDDVVSASDLDNIMLFVMVFDRDSFFKRKIGKIGISKYFYSLYNILATIKKIPTSILNLVNIYNTISTTLIKQHAFHCN